MAIPPTGTVTFLFTDIEGSTRLWEKHGEVMGRALERHYVILQEAIDTHGGFVFKTVGDAVCAAFQTPICGILAAVNGMQRLEVEPWGGIGSLKVRMGLHTGTAEFRDRDYYGSTLNRISRISAAAHGGQLLASHVTVELLRDELPKAVELRDLGSHRLRDLARPEQIYQVIAEGLATEFPALRSLEGIPNNLPIQVTSFIGRDREVAEIDVQLRTVRLLTLIGPGGAGKTRMAQEAGARVFDQYPDGIWFVELAPLSEPERIVEAIIGVVGAREEVDKNPRQSLLSYLHGKRALLILDNCEHLLQMTAQLAAEMIRHCPYLTLLATSRHSLSTSGEVLRPVQPLETPDLFRDRADDPRLIDGLADYPAVKLFLDRAVAVQPDFVLTPENARSVAVICFRLDGIPLAIELAAARLRLLSPKQISERLDDRFRLLRGGHDPLPHRQTLHALIEWSHELLSPDERILFRRMGVFVGGRTVEAIEGICSADGIDTLDILDLLDQLVDKSLVTVERTDGDEPRYTMIESIWQFARTKLEASDEYDAIQERHLDYFLELAERWEPEFFGPGQARRFDQGFSERLNFRAALKWAAKTGSGAKKGLRLITALGRLWEVRGNIRAARELITPIFERPEAQACGLTFARALDTAGRLAWCLDIYDEARTHYERARALFLENGDSLNAAKVGAFIGFLDRGEQKFESAEKWFRAALEEGRAANSPQLTALGYNGLGGIALERGEFEECLKLRGKSLEIYTKIGDRWIVGFILWGLAKVYMKLGNHSAARESIREWGGIAKELGNRWSLPYMLESTAELQLSDGLPEDAAGLYGATEVLREDLGLLYSPAEQADYDACLAALRAALPEETLKDAWEAGRKSSPWEILRRSVSHTMGDGLR